MVLLMSQEVQNTRVSPIEASINAEVTTIRELKSVNFDGEVFKKIEIGGVQYGLSFSGDINKYSEVDLFHITGDNTLGDKIVTLTNLEGHCGLLPDANGESKDIPSMDYNLLKGFLGVIDIIYRVVRIQHIYF